MTTPHRDTSDGSTAAVDPLAGSPPRLAWRTSGTAVRLALPLAVLIALPVLLTSARDHSLLTTAVIYGIVASGLGLIYGQLGLLSMAHAGLWGIGGYTAAIVMTDYGVSFWAALFLATLAGTLAGGVTALPAFRMRGHYLLITSFIITQLLVVVESKWEGLTHGTSGIFVRQDPEPIFGVELQSAQRFYYVCVGVLLVLCALSEVVKRSRLGRRFAATRENALLGSAIGINVRNQVIIGFLLSGIYAGVGGALYAVHLNHIESNLFGLQAAVLLPLIVLIGGAQRTWGPIAGAFIIVFLPEVIGLSPSDAQAAYGLLLIVMILLMPDGILAGVARALTSVSRRFADSRVEETR